MKRKLTIRFLNIALAGACTFLAIACKNGSLPNPSPSTSAQGWYTNHLDMARSGVNSNETQLTLTNVASSSFGKLFSLPIDGDAYAQPLYAPNVSIPGQGTHNVIYVATEADSVYAYDADGKSSTPLWKVNFTDSANGITNLTNNDTGCPDLGPNIGITGTPVIDPATNTMYVVDVQKQTFSDGYYYYQQYLHALDIATGAERPGSPVEIIANDLDPLRSNQRGALALVGNHLFIPYASNCDLMPFNGIMLEYDTTTLEQLSAFHTTEAANAGGIWTLQTGESIDSHGNIFIASGNGLFDGYENFGSSVMRLTDDANGLSLADFFTPPDQATLNNSSVDLDLGSSGILLLPDEAGSSTHPHLLFTAGKSGQAYLIDRDKMGGYIGPTDGSTPSNPDFSNIVQSFNLNGSAYAIDGTDANPTSGGLFGQPIYFNHKIYAVPDSFGSTILGIQAYPISNGQITDTALTGANAIDQSPSSLNFGWPGGSPTISSDGSQNGILWFVDTHYANLNGGEPAILYAFDANNLHQGPIYESDTASGDSAGIAVKHVSPTVINGKVYFATRSEVEVYGLK